MQKPYLPASLALLSGVFCTQFASAQTCAGNSGAVTGSYVFVANENGLITNAITAVVGTTGGNSTVSYSSTELGQLLGGVSGSSAFSTVGSLTFNTFGQVFASPSTAGGSSTLAGTYTVNTDCTVTMLLSDPFGTNTTVTKLSGIILAGGNEVDLFAQTPTTPLQVGTSAPPPSPGIQSQSGLLIRMVRPFFSSFGCSNVNLGGTYGLIVSGTSNGTTPLVLTMRAFFDGAGNVISDPAVVGSSLSALQTVGTYTVNSDCTGTMTVKNPALSTGTNPSATLSFVLTAPNIVVNVGATNISQYSTHPGLVLSLSNATQTGVGFGTAQ